jgi:hypothetical protein
VFSTHLLHFFPDLVHIAHTDTLRRGGYNCGKVGPVFVVMKYTHVISEDGRKIRGTLRGPADILAHGDDARGKRLILVPIGPKSGDAMSVSD